jgi:uncharacterized protein
VFLQSLADQPLQQLGQRSRRHGDELGAAVRHRRGDGGRIPLAAELGQQPLGDVRDAGPGVGVPRLGGPDPVPGRFPASSVLPSVGSHNPQPPRTGRTETCDERGSVIGRHRVASLNLRGVADASTPPSVPDARSVRAAVVAGVLVAAIVFVVALLWAKWLPYAARVSSLAASGAWSGSSILGVGGVKPGDPPSWQAATSFTWAYLDAVWKALVAALLISAAVQSLVPRRWLLRLLNRPGRMASAVAGGLCSTPSMMCTCCTAPVTVTLRRSGVSLSATLAYWLGNPLLNPAVLVFLLLVAPWQWTMTRLVVGAVVVVGGAALVARLVDRRGATAADAASLTDADEEPEPLDREWLAAAPARFARTLLRLSIVLVPEYLVVVLLIGVFRGGCSRSAPPWVRVSWWCCWPPWSGRCWSTRPRGRSRSCRAWRSRGWPRVRSAHS